MNANNKTQQTVQVTARHEVDFFTANGKALFSVNEGIPILEAFDQLSLLLSSAQVAVEALAIAGDGQNGGDANASGEHWVPAHLLTFAYALVQSMHTGLMEGSINAEPTGGMV
ncbi:hypothetical protein BH10PSE16_BH10PSE16_42850 [soil metagenome]